MITHTQPTRHIKTETTVTQIDITSNRCMIGNPPRTVVTTTERCTHHAGGPRDNETTLAAHVAALRVIGAHDAANQCLRFQPEVVTGGFRTVIEGAY